jgi:hypothetical protein
MDTCGGEPGETTWQDLGVTVRLILIFNCKKWDGGERDLRLDKVGWGDVKKVMNLRVSQNTGNFLTRNNQLINLENVPCR